MATPPTFILDNEATVGWNTDPTTPTTATFNSAVGDVWVLGGIGDNPSESFSAPANSGTAQSFTARGTVNATDYCAVNTWTAIVANTLTGQTVSATKAGGSLGGINCVRFSGSDGIGAVPTGETETNGTAPSLDITTTQDNSAIVVFVGDWNAADGASRTWRTVNSITPTAGNGFELTYFRNSSQYTVYIAYYPDAGAAGVKTVGLSTPNMKASIVAVEVKGVAGAAAVDANQARPANPRLPFIPPIGEPVARAFQLLGDAKTVLNTTITPEIVATSSTVPDPATSGGATVTAVAVATTSTVPAPSLATGSAVAATAIATVSTVPAPTVEAQTVIAPAAIATVSTLPAPALSTGSTVTPAAIATVSTAPAPTVTAGTVITPAAVATVAALPAPALSTGSTVEPSAIATVSTVPVPSVTADVGSDAYQASPQFPWLLVAPELQLSGDASTPGAASDATVNATAIATVTTLPAPALSTGSTVTATAIATVADAPAPGVTGGTTADSNQAGPQTAWVFASPKHSALQTRGDATTGAQPTHASVTPSAIATVTTLPAPTVTADGNVTVTPAAIATVTTLPSPTTTAGATVTATAIATVTTLPAPTVRTGSTVTGTVIATVTTLPLPTEIGPPIGIQGSAYPPNRAATGNAYPRADGGIIGSVA